MADTTPAPERFAEPPMLGDPLDLLTPDALCTLLKVRRSWLYDAVEAGTLPALRLGRQLRFRRLDVVAFIDAQTSGGPR